MIAYQFSTHDYYTITLPPPEPKPKKKKKEKKKLRNSPMLISISTQT